MGETSTGTERPDNRPTGTHGPARKTGGVRWRKPGGYSTSTSQAGGGEAQEQEAPGVSYIETGEQGVGGFSATPEPAAKLTITQATQSAKSAVGPVELGFKLFVGEAGKMTADEKSAIVDPLARIMQRNATIGRAVLTYSDPITLAMGIVAYGLRVWGEWLRLRQLETQERIESARRQQPVSIRQARQQPAQAPQGPSADRTPEGFLKGSTEELQAMMGGPLGG